ncbi:MAG: hypothetical protein B6245_13570 [Desulfobacteraceae bacterium 4572_88]|nr:MAG: hypothetical protein B6245_13570 [Desulfobacteraceae bacterium 4572_88]
MTGSEITCIKRIEISKLWGKYDVSWELDPEVNILVGINGSGKSTILNLVHKAVTAKGFDSKAGTEMLKTLKVRFNNNNAIECFFIEDTLKNIAEGTSVHKDKYEQIVTHYNTVEFVRSSESDISTEYLYVPIGSNFDFNKECINANHISAFEMTVPHNRIAKKQPYNDLKSETDFEIYKLVNAFARYQLRLSKKLERLFWGSEQIKAKRAEVYAKRDLFIKSINKLFEKTNKVMKLDRDRRIIFQHDNMVISPYQLSSGEKQILVLLMNVFLQSDRPSIFFMDGPETAIHLEYQKQLIDLIRQINKNIQLIIATHSPVIMEKGWSDKVVEMDTIRTPCH